MKLIGAKPHHCEWTDRATRAEEQLRNLRSRAAFEDPDTGLGNGAQFQRDTMRAIARFRRYGEPCSIALLEFEHVGCPPGRLDPDALSGITQFLIETARLEDSLSRLSDRRFGVVLANADRNGALRFADRVNDRLCAKSWGEDALYLSGAAGVAEWHDGVTLLDYFGDAAEADLSLSRAARERQRVAFGGTGRMRVA